MSDPRLPNREEQVRRLLAEARHDDPLPDDVAERLDRVLADLGPSPDPEGSVLDLRAARRRRTRRTVVLAAAAAVVIGVGVSRVDLTGGPGDSDTVSADSSDDALSELARSDAAGGSVADQDQPAAKERADKLRRVDLYAAAAGPVRLTADSFVRDARRLAVPRRLKQGYSGDLGAARGADSCAEAAWSKGRQVPARYDGERAVVVLRPVQDGARVVDLYLCGADEPLRSTTVPAG